MVQQLILTTLPAIPHIQRGDDLSQLIVTALEGAAVDLRQGDLLVIAQKIVSKAEGRIVNLNTVDPSGAARDLAREVKKDPRMVELVLRESRQVLRKRTGLLIVEHRLGFVCANAGIDQSNLGLGEDQVLLLPEDPDRTANELRSRLTHATGVDVGVLIIDSHGRAWRLGTVGVVIGIAGVPGVLDLRGKGDLFGRRLRITEVGVADELSAAASLLMGQDSQGTPVIHVRGFPYRLRESSLEEMIRPEEEDLFR
jgi:coenzyme F420-0:L-glutamate ligase/coenzyme F420-1:gamma-L-glutamate ligase